MGKKISLEDTDDEIYFSDFNPDAIKAQNQRNKNIAKHYLHNPTLLNLIKAAYYYGNSNKNEKYQIIGGIAPNPSLKGNPKTLSNIKNIKGFVTNAKNVINGRITKQGIRNSFAKAGDNIIHGSIGAGLANIGSNALYDKYIEPHIKVKDGVNKNIPRFLFNFMPTVIGYSAGNALLNDIGTKYNILNDIINKPVETAIELSKKRYPLTVNKKAVQLRKMFKEFEDIGNIEAKGLKLKPVDLQLKTAKNNIPGVYGDYDSYDKLIRINTTINNKSNLPISYSTRLGNSKDVFRHELRHHIQHNNSFLNYSKDPIKAGDYFIPNDNAKSIKAFDAIKEYEGSWHGSPNEVDSELSYVQSALNLRPIDYPSSKGVTYIADRFDISDKDAENIIKELIKRRKLYNFFE